jgi:D-alanyl-D-alanine carboxypeptidase
MKRNRFFLISFLIITLSTLIILGIWFGVQKFTQKDNFVTNESISSSVFSSSDNSSDNSSESSILSKSSINTSNLSNSIFSSSKQQESSETIYKQFTGSEFKDFYDNFSYSKVDEITEKPTIRGQIDADKKIQELAEKRGYKLRFEAICQCFQIEASQDWAKLKAAASKEADLNLVLVSGFRSIKDQRDIFLNQITNWSNQAISEGQADEAINDILVTRSIPGYSKHHTGYTIDLGCNSQDLINFKNTLCYQWLSANNYENAKRFGFIPSYPQGATNQGPDPEQWEFVWVGEENLKN